MASPESGKSNFIWSKLERPNYRLSRFGIEPGILLTAIAAATGHYGAVFLGGLNYFWDRRTIINYEKKHPEAVNQKVWEIKIPLLGFLNPSLAKGSQRFNFGSARAA